MSDHDDVTDCAVCSIGTYSNAGEVCQTCQAGRYNSDPATDSSLHESCILCVAGKFNDDAGEMPSKHDNENDCIPCPNGESSLAGAAGCSSCEKGKYAHEETGFCTECPAGRANSLKGAVSSIDCKVCIAGTFAAIASEICSDCAKGRYNPHEGNETCIDCGAGRYNTETAQISESACELCSIGKYSSAATATEDCSMCPYHSYSPARGAKACMPCEAGKNNFDQTASKCSDCPAGKSSKPGMWNSCPTNFTFYKSVCYQDLISIEGTCESFGGSLCTSQELLIVDGTIGYNSSSSYCCRPPDFHGGDCELCKGNEYTPDAGYPICINCPSFQEPTEDKLGCESASGYYTDVTIDGTKAFPTGEGVKPTPGTTLQSLELEPGYWRTSINDTLVRECPNPGEDAS